MVEEQSYGPRVRVMLSHHTWIWAKAAATWGYNTDCGKGAEFPASHEDWAGELEII